MAARKPAFHAQVVFTLFTSIVAPILVSTIVRDLNLDSSRDAQAVSHQEAISAPAHPASCPAGRPAATTSLLTPSASAEVSQILASGEGRTADEALEDALRNALRQAVAARIDALTWSRNGHAIAEVLLHEGGVIVRCEERRSSRRWSLTGPVHHKEVAVTVDGAVLADRLQRACSPTPQTIPLTADSMPLH